MGETDARAGAARVLAAVYTFFAVAAGARAVVQLAIDPERAPVAYALSALSAGFYLIGAVAFRGRGRRSRAVATLACGVEQPAQRAKALVGLRQAGQQQQFASQHGGDWVFGQGFETGQGMPGGQR